jgi:GR25 family glycosyltransferase involved in LPS biosynthesis
MYFLGLSKKIIHFAVTLLIIAVICAFFFSFVHKKIEGFEEMNYMDGVDIIYWINLDRSEGRRKTMEIILSNELMKGTPNQRFAAIDGKKPKEMYSMLGDNGAKRDRSDFEYACLLSHLEVIRAFNNSSYDIALVLEDDITMELSKYWKKSMREIIENAPKDWEIIQLYYNVNETGFLKDDYTINDMKDGTVSYLINKKGSSKIIDEVYKNDKYFLSDQYQHVADRYLYKTLITYVYSRPYFIYNTNNASTINPNQEIDLNDKTKAAIFSEYKKLYP